MMRKSYQTLIDALERTVHARKCIAQNRGYDRELARQGYESAVALDLVPALIGAMDDAAGDLPDRDLERIATDLMKKLRAAGQL